MFRCHSERSNLQSEIRNCSKLTFGARNLRIYPMRYYATFLYADEKQDYIMPFKLFENGHNEIRDQYYDRKQKKQFCRFFTNSADV
jgi:hypothetical protein